METNVAAASPSGPSPSRLAGPPGGALVRQCDRLEGESRVRRRADHARVATRERPVDRGTLRGRDLVVRIGREIREARLNTGLSLASVARAAGISAATLSRVERGLSGSVPLLRLARLCAIVGLELSAGAYPGGDPLRDAAHAGLLRGLRGRLHRSLGWGTEVPFPSRGDQRAWDGMISGPGWRYGVEAETSARDGQALARRLEIKRRDGGADGVILLLPDTRRTAEFLRAFGDLLRPNFPVDGRRALELLGAGVDPGGSTIIVLAPVRADGSTSRWRAQGLSS